jgi:TAG lipase/steryl ester hydrolase/phospholipase A2/LPA acyltransferase
MSELSRLEKTLSQSGSYREWLETAQVLDELEGKDRWCLEPESEDYDYRLLKSRIRLFRKLRKQKDYDQLIFRLREELHGNIANMANPALYQFARTGTKKLINEYLDEVTASLNLLCDSNVRSLPPMRKRRFILRAARSFGRSALLLSGGASLGLFHLGVIEELIAEGILPRVISGSSAGSLIAGILATHTDEELKQLINPGQMNFEWFRMFGLVELLKNEGAADQKLLQKFIATNILDMTFLEAYKQTGRIVNISISPTDPHQFPRLLNYLTSPNVLIRRAVLASTAIPGLFPPVKLRAKNFAGKSVAYMPQSLWIDGTLHEDIPKDKVNRLHNVNHYIVSQTNPHVVPFLNEEIEPTGLLPFVQDVILKAPMVQLEHILDLVHRHFDIPGLSSVIQKAHAMISQTYSGDITVYPDRHLGNIGKMFSNPGPDEYEKMLLEGRRATWPNIERIRNTTQISRTFDDCLKRMSQRFRYVKR